MSDTVHGYGADAELDGWTLRLTATGKMGRGALGTDVREIDVPQLRALSYTKGNMIKNGHLELVDERGKSIVHFRKKDNDQWRSLYERLVEVAPDGADEVPTDDAPLFSEDAQATIPKVEAWAERKKAEAEAEAKKAAKRGA